jgi:hypothetical protein
MIRVPQSATPSLFFRQWIRFELFMLVSPYCFAVVDLFRHRIGPVLFTPY